MNTNGRKNDSSAARELGWIGGGVGWWGAVGWWLNSSALMGAPLAVSGPGEAKHYGLVLGVFALVMIAGRALRRSRAQWPVRRSQAPAEARREVRP